MPQVSRRTLLGAIAAGSLAGLAGCSSSCPDDGTPVPDRQVRGSDGAAGPFERTPGSAWRRPRHDPGNTGYAPGVDPPSGSVGIRWAISLPTPGEDGASHQYSTPAVADGTVYVCAPTGVHALDLLDGASIWHAQSVTPDTVGSTFDYDEERIPPVVGPGGTVFVAGVTGLAALDPADGSIRWEFDGNGTGGGNGSGDGDGNGSGEGNGNGTGDGGSSQGFGAPTVAAGTVVVPREDALYALDPGDGSVRWTARLPQNHDGSLPAVGDGTVVVSSYSETVAVDVATGDLRWTARSGTDYFPVVADGTVYLGNFDGLQGIGLSDGEELWRFERGGGRSYTAPVVAEDTIYAVEQPGEGPDATFALNRTGEEPTPRWCSYLGEGGVTAAGGDLSFVLQSPTSGPDAPEPIDLVAFGDRAGDAPWGLAAGGRYERVVPPAVLDGAVVAVDDGGTVTALGEV